MRKFLSFGFFIALVLPVVCYPAQYSSPLGYSANIPPGWEVINSKKLLEDPDHKKRGKMLEHIDFASKEQRQKILRLFEEGKLDCWYREADGNVTVGLFSGQGVCKRSQFEEFKKAIKQVHPGIVAHDLDLKKISGIDAMYWEWNGLIYGKRTLTLNVQVNPNAFFKFNLVGEDNFSFNDLRKEFWDIMSTVRFYETAGTVSEKKTSRNTGLFNVEKVITKSLGATLGIGIVAFFWWLSRKIENFRHKTKEKEQHPSESGSSRFKSRAEYEAWRQERFGKQ